ncbi:MAG TPA: hypothetical protein QF564_10050 [Pirellulaceae bacterium]|nr:hypothetical protein [Pirellulaceae bacterium]
MLSIRHYSELYRLADSHVAVNSFRQYSERHFVWGPVNNKLSMARTSVAADADARGSGISTVPVVRIPPPRMPQRNRE